jgi:hypothetical protein
MWSKALFFAPPFMNTLFLRKAISSLAVAATLVGMAPGVAFASSLSAPSNVNLVGGVYTNDTTPTATWTRPNNATWYEFLVDNGSWQSLGNVNSVTLWTLSTGWHTFFVRAHDNAGNISTSSSVTFEIDIQGPTVSTVSPNTATEDVSTTLAVTASGEAAIMFCDLYVNGTNIGGMTKYSGTSFKKVYTFNNDGAYTVYARCADGDGNYTTGASRTVAVAEDDDEDPVAYETFWVNDVTPTSATEDESTTMRVTTSGTLDAATCLLYVNGSSVGTMSESSSNSFSKSYTFSNDGSYTVYALCQNEQGIWDRSDSKTVTVSEVDDEETFTVPYVIPTSATEDEEETFSVTPYGTLEAETCKLYVSGTSVGTMDESGGTFRLDYTFTNDGDYTVYAYCENENGDWVKGSSRTVSVDEEDDDTDSLDVPAVTPGSADEDERTEFTVEPDSDYNVTDCWLYVDGSRVATMNEESTNRFVADYTFSNDGSYSVYAYCKDSSGDTATGDKRTVRVSDDGNTDNDDDADEGSLIKTACGTTTTVNDPCKAVYYYGEDGKRHVFPNEATYFTWYNDFDDVVEVSSSFMSSLTIGKNVTFRPGSVLVKFDSSSSIYAVEKEHTLRRYTTTGLIESDYGDDYEDVLVSISDSLYSNYTIGSVIDSTSDFDRDDEYYSVDSIDDVL